MPELAEVETTRRDLEKIIKGKTIRKTLVYLDKVVYNKKEAFINATQNKKIIDVKRRGKWLLFEFDGSYLVIHFRMEGRFYLKKIDDEVSKHDYVIFIFNDFSLHYNDPRVFGKMEVVPKKDISNFFESKKLGLEYDDERLDGKYLKKVFKGHHIGIKKALLSQNYITGLGNIYTDEILFLSKINPKSYVDRLTVKNLNAIILNTKKVFEVALKEKGTYPNIDGNKGKYEKYLQVYQKNKTPCPVCGALIKREEIAGRGTYYCPNCQRKV